MKNIAIRCEGVSKQYQLGQRESYKTLRDTLTKVMYAPFRRLRFQHSDSRSKKVNETIWSLKDVSFEVRPGEVVGIIGSNGAGKSTLLKILSRITKPTRGYAEIQGRVGSLLEVGTGFNPELTGRENIYLNGAILGMKRAEINRKFDEMVAFAEIEKFIDTPVKRYSSGMYVRLAFAVAAHLEPEILLVDEVLSVGDAAFQKKCLGKMGNAANGGRTVMFVSHQMNQVRRLCEHGIWLDRGQIKKMGPAADVINAYEAEGDAPSLESVLNNENDDAMVRFIRWGIAESHPEQSNVLTALEPITLRFTLKINRPVQYGYLTIHLYNAENQLVWSMEMPSFRIGQGVHDLICKMPSLPLRPGTYSWRVCLHHHMQKDTWDCLPHLIISTKPATYSRDNWTGVLNLPCEFSIESYNGKLQQEELANL